MKNPTRYSQHSRMKQRGGRRNDRRSGYVAVLVAAAWLALCGVAALSFDLSRMYTRKAEAQKAADACALVGAAAYGGAMTGSTAGSASGALAVVKQYATANGYDVAQGATVVGGPGSGADAGLYRVNLSRPEKVYFARVFFGPTMNVWATAAAQYTQNQDVPLQNYGVSGSIVTLSVFGPNAYKYNGDPYSVKWASADGPTASTNQITSSFQPDYNPNGHTFNITPATTLADFRTTHTDPISHKALMDIEIFDPGSNNNGGDSAQIGQRVDEQRPGWGGQTLTTTQYTLLYDGVPVPNGTKTFGPGNQGPDMAWDKTFQVDLNDPLYSTNKAFTVNVKAIDGTSENGFTMRAGADHPANMTDADWVSQYGSEVTMTSKDALPLNYTDSGFVTIDLGVIPAIPQGGQVTIRKFDADVVGPGATSNTVTYYDTQADGTVITRQGNIAMSAAANGVWAPDDVFALGDNYKGGHWTAKYTAGSNDTSAWQMKYSGPGDFRLVR